MRPHRTLAPRRALGALALLASLAPACTRMAIDDYIEGVQQDPSRATATSPPTCAHGAEGRDAIVEAFEATSPGEDVGGLRVATFLTLTCLRVEAILDALGGRGGGPQVFKARVPVEERDLEVMVEAWAQEETSHYREAMTLGVRELDHQAWHALYTRLRQRDLIDDELDFPVPRGLAQRIPQALEPEREAIRVDWCERVAPVELVRLTGDDEAEGAAETVTGKYEALEGLVINRCAQGDEALTFLLERGDRGVRDAEQAMRQRLTGMSAPRTQPPAPKNPAESGDPEPPTEPLGQADPPAYASAVEEGLRVLDLQWRELKLPALADIGALLAAQASVRPEEMVQDLELIDRAEPSCAFAARLQRGFDRVRDELPAPSREVLRRWNQEHLERCQLTRWPALEAPPQEPEQVDEPVEIDGAPKEEGAREGDDTSEGDGLEATTGADG